MPKELLLKNKSFYVILTNLTVILTVIFMCGIVGAVSERNITPILLAGLTRLEYRGYDSAGVAVINKEQNLECVKTLNKVKDLNEKVTGIEGNLGIAHTRWATHGLPVESNAHPHIVNNRLALVHNGIVENYSELKQFCINQGAIFSSDTDTEVIVQLINITMQKDNLTLYDAVRQTLPKLKGAYGMAVIDAENPDEMIAVRQGSPLTISLGFGENFISSDPMALLFISQQYVVLEENDLAILRKDSVVIENSKGKVVFDSNDTQKSKYKIITSTQDDAGVTSKGGYRHFMHKEIHEQPKAIAETLEGCISDNRLLVECFGQEAAFIFSKIKRVQIIACGTSYHSGMVFRYWCEDIIGIPVDVEVASEFRYRNPAIEKDVLFVAISQSGETADTAEALKIVEKLKKQAEGKNHWSILTISNKAESTLVRYADLVFLTRAGFEVGVASTKAFTTQLVALSLLMIALGKSQKRLSETVEKRMIQGLRKVPKLVQSALDQEEQIIELSNIIANSQSALFLGRGTMYPIALEGALKLKEISYIHAEAFPAGELKHGPLALVDEETPVIVIAPNNDLLIKLKSNLEEVSSRGGKIYAFEDKNSKLTRTKSVNVISVAENVGRISCPLLFTIPLQLLSYHVARIKGTDIDQPRNLAKSVTVE
jgi:glucosamine--fructose-6-phosphate aminotransferase (isomerizing)